MRNRGLFVLPMLLCWTLAISVSSSFGQPPTREPGPEHVCPNLSFETLTRIREYFMMERRILPSVIPPPYVDEASKCIAFFGPKEGISGKIPRQAGTAVRYTPTHEEPVIYPIVRHNTRIKMYFWDDQNWEWMSIKELTTAPYTGNYVVEALDDDVIILKDIIEDEPAECEPAHDVYIMSESNPYLDYRLRLIEPGESMKFTARISGLSVISNGNPVSVYDTNTGEWEPMTDDRMDLERGQRIKVENTSGEPLDFFKPVFRFTVQGLISQLTFPDKSERFEGLLTKNLQKFFGNSFQFSLRDLNFLQKKIDRRSAHIGRNPHWDRRFSKWIVVKLRNAYYLPPKKKK